MPTDFRSLKEQVLQLIYDCEPQRTDWKEIAVIALETIL
jgi:hypothetical protein